MVEQIQQQVRGNVIYPDQLKQIAERLNSIVNILIDIPTSLVSLRRIFRGEVMWQDEKGQVFWVQIVKPVFVKIDFESDKPIKVMTKMPWNEMKETYIPNDEAIEEILSMLSFMGINNITPITNLSEDTILDDLKEFEMKLSAILALKQKEWGMDKELLPMIMTKIKTCVQDVRYMARAGTTITAIQTNVQRMEQMIEGDKAARKILNGSPYG